MRVSRSELTDSRLVVDERIDASGVAHVTTRTPLAVLTNLEQGAPIGLGIGLLTEGLWLLPRDTATVDRLVGVLGEIREAMVKVEARRAEALAELKERVRAAAGLGPA